MPYPAQTDRATIIETARMLIERGGGEEVTLADVAAALGIKAPSLYRHVPSKTALLQAVVTLTFEQLFQACHAAIAAAGDNPSAQVRALGHAHRAFAHANPHTYVLALTTTAREERADHHILKQLVVPLEPVVATLVGVEHVLPALRGILAFVHGFVMLELHQQFQRGGDLDAAFTLALDTFLAGWQTLGTYPTIGTNGTFSA